MGKVYTCFRDSNPPDLIGSLPIWCLASRSPDFYQILPIYYKILKTREKLVIFRIFGDLSLWNTHIILTFFAKSIMVCYNSGGMMSKFMKWHLREPKFAKFPGGPCPRTPLEARAFGANNYSLFSITWGWNLCCFQTKTWPNGAAHTYIACIREYPPGFILTPGLSEWDVVRLHQVWFLGRGTSLIKNHFLWGTVRVKFQKVTWP